MRASPACGMPRRPLISAGCPGSTSFNAPPRGARSARICNTQTCQSVTRAPIAFNVVDLGALSEDAPVRT